MILRFNCQLIKHPYADEESSKYEKWAEIKLMLFDESNKLIKVVFDRQWDVIVFLNWVSENKEALVNERTPLEIEGSSIAKGIFDFYNNLDSASETLIETIYSYRQRHGIRFAFRGIAMDDLYIGRLNNALTISQYVDDENQWNFDIMADQFINDIQNALSDISR